MTASARRALWIVAAAAVAVLGVYIVRETKVPRAESGWTGLRFAQARRADSLRVAGPGPSLDAAWFRPRADVRAAVLLIHGNREAGADHPLYRVLATALAERGAIVLALSLRGYGASADAPDGVPLSAADLDFDLRRGLDALAAAAPAGVPRLLVGHSLGANLALRECGAPGLTVMAVEPGLQLRERVVEPPAPELPEFTRKLRRNVRGGSIDAEVVRRLYGDLDPETPAGPVAEGSCTVIYSARLSPEDRASVERMASARPGTSIEWIGNRRHDFGVIDWRGAAVYPGPAVDGLADTIRRIGWD